MERRIRDLDNTGIQKPEETVHEREKLKNGIKWDHRKLEVMWDILRDVTTKVRMDPWGEDKEKGRRWVQKKQLDEQASKEKARQGSIEPCRYLADTRLKV
jgi:hypothetical protein